MPRYLIRTAFIGAIVIGAAAGTYLYTLRPPVKVTPFGWPADVQPFAGNGLPAFADGACAAAGLSDPWGMARDAQGNLYVSDGGEANRIRKITPECIVSTFAGGEEGFADGAQAQFNTPSGIARDLDGNLIVADTGNHAIRKISPQGLVTTLAGDGQPGDADGVGRAARFNGPVGIAVDVAGTVYVADTYNDRIRKITRDGTVSTIAGGARPGFADGAQALFDTPSALAVNPLGEIFVADTRNGAIRKIAANGSVSTIARGDPEDRNALLRRPTALAMTHDGFLYIGDSVRGRILQMTPDGALKGLTGKGIDYSPGEYTVERLQEPAGLLLDGSGLLVSDPARHAIRRIAVLNGARTPPSAQVAVQPPPAQMPWPVNPNSQSHEIVGTMGEVRGEHKGDSRHHFHGGLDVQAALGAPVTAIASEKVLALTPNWGENTLNEGMGLPAISYIHMKVGRSADDKPLDARRFLLSTDDAGKPRVRVRRGTRFAQGEVLGSVNRMYHTHLEYSQAGVALNPLLLPLRGARDSIEPVIGGIWLQDANGQKLAAPKKGKLALAGDAEYSVVVDAFDRMDGTLARRRLGLYQLGYQLLRSDGSPLPGFESPRITQQYDRLPPDRESVKTVYADESGITVYGSKETRFLYQVTNTLLEGRAGLGKLSLRELPAGEYVLRIYAADFAGNAAREGRDLAFSVVR